MATLDAITGEPAIIAQLNSQDAQQNIQSTDDEEQATADDLREAVQAQRASGEENDAEPTAAVRNEGDDRETDQGAEDTGNVTEDRGQNVNLVA